MDSTMDRIAARAAWLAVAAGLLCDGAMAAVGTTVIAATATGGQVTVFYPTDAPASPVVRGPFTVVIAPDAAVASGNGHLVVLSHGSGASPWVYTDLASALVDAGFVVAVPRHRGDNAADPSHPGPDSWTQRPGEVSRAIDAVSRDPRFADRLDFAHVGLYGMSAGGHTALSLAGGRWSPARFRDHCEAHLADDFQFCVGLATRLTGSPLDAVRKWVASLIIRFRFDDAMDRVDRDDRIAAVVAAVPAAADFDPASLARPAVPLGLATAKGDRWLVPRFHADRILAACAACEHVVDIRDGGHGAFLSPLPTGLEGIEATMLNDPPGFDRATTTATVDSAVVAFFRRHLLGGR